MFALLVAEKNGTKKRLEFEKGDISIGRVQGNDVVLPKGNVSKRHARIAFQSGHYVVIDAESTNGTYVNGRKITAPLTIKHGDRIYIGDFVIQLELDEVNELLAPDTHETDHPEPIKHVELTPIEPQDPAEFSDQISDAKTSTRPPPRNPFRLDQEPDSNAELFVDQKAFAAVESSDVDQLGPLATLMARLAERFNVHDIEPSAMRDHARWTRAQSAIEETLVAMKRDGSLGEVEDVTELASAALHEAVGLGPLDELLSNEALKEVLVSGTDRISADTGNGIEDLALRISSQSMLHTVTQRLAAQTGRRLARQTIFQGVLPFGPMVTIIQSPLAVGGPVIEIRSRRIRSLRELAADGLMTTDMADLLLLAIQSDKNIVVAGPQGAGVTTILSALATELKDRGRVMTIEAIPDLAIDRTRVVSLSCADTERTLGEVIRDAARLRADRLVIDDITAEDWDRAIAAVASRAPGHLLGVHTTGSGGALAQMMSANEMSASILHLIVRMRRTPQGSRVVQIAEVQKAEGGSAKAVLLYRFENDRFEQLADASFA
ncbi:MAG: ATPase, T2SS/T4P/T4SS family [Polyangiales bacterium]